MKDRVPTYPGRVKLIPVAGQADTYDMVRADEPIEEGTPLNKASLLNDSVQKAIWGSISDSRTVNSALGRLNSYLPKIQLNYVYTIDDTPRALANAASLSVARYSLAAATVGNYALFGGGRASGSSDSSSVKNTVDAYDESLTHTTPTALSAARMGLAATTVGNYALFAGGGYKNAGTPKNTVDAYDQNLTRTTPSVLSAARGFFAATKVGNYALFGGGEHLTSTSNKAVYSTVDAYDSNLTRTTPPSLSVARHSLAAASVGNYALFGGGLTAIGASTTASLWGEQSAVDAYDRYLTHIVAPELSIARGKLAATTVGSYALFGGGAVYSGPEGDDTYGTVRGQTVVDAYNTNLTRSTPTGLSTAEYELNAVKVGNYAMFGDSHHGTATSNPFVINIYNWNLVRTTLSGKGATREEYAAAAIGGYALFGGGSGITAAVNVFVSQYEAHFTIPAWSKYKFDGYHTEEQFTMVDLPWSSKGDVSGYIRPTGYTLEDKLPTNN